MKEEKELIVLGDIEDTIREGIHYNCKCKSCERRRDMLDFLVGVNYDLENKIKTPTEE